MPIKLPIYMDNHATTPLDPRVLEAMMPYLTTEFGNAASRSHAFGWKAEEAVDQAREQMAALIGGNEKEIVFTSRRDREHQPRHQGRGRVLQGEGQPHHHRADRAQGDARHLKRLERQGYEVTYLPRTRTAGSRAQQLREAITDKTILVSVMLANNEIGTVQPIARDRQAVTARRACSSTATRCRASARCPSTWRR